MGEDNAVHQPNKAANPLETFCLTVAEDLAMLAVLHNEEPSAELIDALRSNGFPKGLGLRLKSEHGLQAVDLMEQALKALPERIEEGTLDEFAADYASIYLNYGIHASPEESVWIDEDSLVCQDTMFQVRAWYEHYDLAVLDWRKRPDDHLVPQLQFVAHLLGNDPTEDSLGKAAQFMDEHLLRWLSDFGNRVAQRCATPYFAGLALVSSTYCEELRDLLAKLLNKPRPSQEEIDERMKPNRTPDHVPVSFVPGMGALT